MGTNAHLTQQFVFHNGQPIAWGKPARRAQRQEPLLTVASQQLVKSLSGVSLAAQPTSLISCSLDFSSGSLCPNETFYKSIGLYCNDPSALLSIIMLKSCLIQNDWFSWTPKDIEISEYWIPQISGGSKPLNLTRAVLVRGRKTMASDIQQKTGSCAFWPSGGLLRGGGAVGGPPGQQDQTGAQLHSTKINGYQNSG